MGLSRTVSEINGNNGQKETKIFLSPAHINAPDAVLIFGIL